MPTAITHIVAGVALGQAAEPEWGRTWKFWSLATFCAVLPDLDALGFYLGIPYGSIWGHRGFLHSLAFALISGTVLSFLLRCSARERWKPALLLTMIVASHDVLDAMTNGGLGIAFFSPWNLHRYFFPWRPIRVSPIGARFFSARGVAALKSELLLVWGPALVLGILFRLLKTAKRIEAQSATAVE